MWAFVNGSSADYGCGGYPTQAAVPYENERGQFVYNEIRSPFIPVSGAGGNFELHYDQYTDLDVDPLVFGYWRVRSIVDGCPGPWRNRSRVELGSQKAWIPYVHAFGDLVDPAATAIQVALGVRDMCDVWCGVYGSGACHSHAPLYDDVEVIRIDSNGPVWFVEAQHLFQDTFAEDGNINDTSTGRADMAMDIAGSSNAAIDPGDSAVVVVSDDHGIATDPFTGIGPAVYLYLSVWPQGQAAIHGGSLLDKPTFGEQFAVVDSMTQNGDTWYCVRMDTVFVDGDVRLNPLEDRWCVDLNDNLFTVGDTICFFFGAENTLGERTWWTPFTGTTDNMTEALAYPDEFQILPGANPYYLYVDAFDGHGAQPYFDTAFEFLGITDEVDRFDVRAPGSNVGNSPGSRVKNVFVQLISAYNTIIWNTGNLSAGTIGDGTGEPDKSDDASLLYTFLDQTYQMAGIYFSGDDLADELYNKPNPGLGLVNLRAYIQGAVNPGDGDHKAAGYGTNALVVGEPGSCFDHVPGPDELIAYAGCPSMNDHDVITPTGTSTLEMNYGGTPGQSKGAVISQRTQNAAASDVGVMLSGFSFHEIRDAEADGVPARAHHLSDVLRCTGDGPSTPPIGARPVARRTTLSQNYPNPFNPVTTIEFTVRERTPVTLRVYNAAGQLVRTLVSDVRAPGVMHTVEWDGRSDAGTAVASGVYFYRLVTADVTQTRKMVLLK
jgi:hypothetical protein